MIELVSKTVDLYRNLYCSECLATMSISSARDRIVINHSLGSVCSRTNEPVVLDYSTIYTRTSEGDRPFIQIPRTNCPECFKPLLYEMEYDTLRVKFTHRISGIKQAEDTCQFESIKPRAIYTVYL